VLQRIGGNGYFMWRALCSSEAFAENSDAESDKRL